MIHIVCWMIREAQGLNQILRRRTFKTQSWETRKTAFNKMRLEKVEYMVGRITTPLSCPKSCKTSWERTTRAPASSSPCRATRNSLSYLELMWGCQIWVDRVWSHLYREGELWRKILCILQVPILKIWMYIRIDRKNRHREILRIGVWLGRTRTKWKNHHWNRT